MHNIGITVHGATDSDGNKVTNPKVGVYGKNMFRFNAASDVGFTFKDSSCRIVNPTRQYHYTDILPIKLPAGTYTLSASIHGTMSLSDLGVIISYYHNNEMKNFSGRYKGDDITLSTVITLTEKTTINFNNVYLSEIPQTADITIDFQLEVGDAATEFEEYKEQQTASQQTSFGEGEVFKIETFTAVSPNMTVVVTDDNNLISTVDVVYNADLKGYIDSKISEAIGDALGGDY